MACYWLRAGRSGDRIPVWGRDFSHPSRSALRPTQPPTQCVPGLSRGVNRPGRGIDHSSPSIAEVKERVELHLYSPSRLSWPVLWRNLPLHLPGVMATDVITVNTISSRVSALISLQRYTRVLISP